MKQSSNKLQIQVTIIGMHVFMSFKIHHEYALNFNMDFNLQFSNTNKILNKFKI